MNKSTTIHKHTSQYTKITTEHKRTIKILISILEVKYKKYLILESNVSIAHPNSTPYTAECPILSKCCLFYIKS